MRKINKDELKASPDYLNFIRRNQQIVQEFKEITQVESKGKGLKKALSGIPEQPRSTIQVDRYSEVQPGYSTLNQPKVTSLRDILPSQIMQSNPDVPISSRRHAQSDGLRPEIYTRNLIIPEREAKGSDDARALNDELKLSKLSSRLSHQPNSITELSDNS